jgi:pyruvate,water dikinase
VYRAHREVHEAGRKVGICGQSPSDYPDFARFLVKRGIDSISLSFKPLPAPPRGRLELEKSADRGLPEAEAGASA